MTIATTTSQNKIDFPPYLAYGVAIPETRRWEDGALVQDYYLDGERVLTVSFDEHYATVQEWWKGESYFSTSYPNLYQALLAHFVQFDQGSSPIHAFWMRRLCDIGNIYVDRLPVVPLKQLRFP